MEHAYGLGIPRTLDEVCDPRRMALVVYDMQVGVVGQIARAPEIVHNVTQLVAAARAGGYRVYYLRHMSVPKEIAGTAQLRTAMEWQRVAHVGDVTPVFLRDSPEFALIPELSPRSSEMIFDKIAMSAFVGTPLDIVLRDCGIDSFAIAGVAMEVGIEPTVRHAIDLGYLPVVVADACGAGNEAAARRSLETLAFAGSSLQTDVATISRLLRGEPDPGGE
ncbi:MAG: cysteine hydrolase family protein [Pseudonocardiaceae bacterium]